MQEDVYNQRGKGDPSLKVVRDGNSPARILLAEDDREMRQLLAQALRDEGYEVVEVSDGLGALHQLPFEELDLIITDHEMPGTTGLGILESLLDADQQTPVVVISAFADGEVCKQAKRLGAAAVFAKPFSLNEFLYKVRSILPGT